MARKRIKTIIVNGQTKKVEVHTTTKAVWQEQITCAHVTSQTVAGAEKSRKYLKATKESRERVREQKEYMERRKAFDEKWEREHYAELFRNADKNLSYVH